MPVPGSPAITISIALSAKGLTTGEISAHLAEVYGAQVSRQTISTITDKVTESMTERANRPLDAVYPVIFLDAIHVKIRDGKVANRPIYGDTLAVRLTPTRARSGTRSRPYPATAGRRCGARSRRRRWI